ncbi:DUF2812 domain-containing protein [Lysinibacillus antri]|uniref:DUF2812 domain-containing protein n=1 Tax=Lysinibacillus antri TaxID=2498145 RepID=A0A432L8U0_9BACI|nr:DUF2812 domain-containing protein [Lysinibacillus antri]RUL48818.1 DUF2812 domain-containing protein [Lysinibacillus antri]
MKQVKYIPSGGLAFFEEKEMKKLAEYAKEGWILEKIAGLGYKLRKGERKDIEYSLDYQKEVDDEYFALFEAAGWSHVCSVGNEIHIFSASTGTKPIYTDRPTTIEKYEREKKQMGKSALPFFISTVVFWLLGIFSNPGWASESITNLFQVLGLISLAILIFPGLPYLSYQFKLLKLRKE